MVDQTFLWNRDVAAAILLSGAILAPVIAYRTWLLPGFPGRIAFVSMLPSAAWWSIAAAVECLVPSREAKLFWAEMAWLGIVATPTCWGAFVWIYIYGGEDNVLPRWVAALSIMPVVTWILALTNESHHLLYLSANVIGTDPTNPLHYVHGPWYYIVTVYCYAFLLATVAMILRAVWDSVGVYRRHYLGFLAAMLGPWAFNIGYQTGDFNISSFDPTPFSFIVTGSIFFWLIQRNQLFSLVPVARGILLNTMSDPVLVVDRRGIVVDTNRAAAALPHMPAMLIGTALADLPELEFALHHDLEEPAQAVDDIALGDQYFEVRRAPLVYMGREVGQLMVLRETTQRRAMEDELRHAKVRAEKALDVQRQVMREQRNFLSMVGHEFRTPLSIISSASQVLSMDDKGPETAREIAKISRAINRMVDLIDACLADDRLESAALLFQPRVVNLTALIAEACADCRGAGEGRELRFDTTPLVTAECDGTTISVVISNLLDNAVKYSPEDQPVDIAVSTRDGMAFVEIADRGPGIDPSERRAIFEKFYRASSSEHIPGAGLGLYLVGRIVGLHRGRIDVLAREGGGSRFIVSLPVRRSANT